MSAAHLHPAAAGATASQRRASPSAHDWQQHLPADWRQQVVVALDFTEHREYEMPASRTLGRDAEGALCYYAHRYLLEESRSDDDEDFYRVVAYGEQVHAWRLRDERWLIYRQVQSGDEQTPGRAFYSFSAQPPR